MSDSFDVIVIGGGPAGYPAAIRAAQNKLSVACIDEWKNRDGSTAFGGTCLNAGCIPSKALLESSELYHRAQHEFAAHGVKLEGIGFDVAAMQKRKGGIVKQMTGGILSLFKSAGVTPLTGHGRLLAGKKVEFTGPDGAKRTLQAKHVVLASGSEPMPLRGVAFDGMQPAFRQVPPKAGLPSRFFHSSIQATDSLFWPARIAAGYPAGPPPMTMTSKLSLMMPRSIRPAAEGAPDPRAPP